MGNNNSQDTFTVKQNELSQKYFKIVEKQEYKKENPYFIVLFGASQSGKSSFLKTFLKNDQKIDIGDGVESCTKNFITYKIENEELFGNRGALIVDTIGFGDSSGELDDSTILSLLYSKLMTELNLHSEQLYIDYFFVFQSSTGLNRTKPLIKDILICFPELKSDNLVIIFSKSNLLKPEDEDQKTKEQWFDLIQKDLKNLQLDSIIIDYQTSYQRIKTGKIFNPSDEQVKEQSKLLQQFINNQNNIPISLYGRWNEIIDEANKIYKKDINDELNKKFGEAMQKYNDNNKIKNIISLFMFPGDIYLNTMAIKKKCRTEIIEFFEKSPALAFRSIENVLIKEMHRKKFNNSIKQVDQIKLN